jgi:hypothetical protein
VLAVALAVLPRRADLIGLCACAAAILIAVQLGVSYWFYLYIPWFFGPAIVVLLGAPALVSGTGRSSLWLRPAGAPRPG